MLQYSCQGPAEYGKLMAGKSAKGQQLLERESIFAEQ